MLAGTKAVLQRISGSSVKWRWKALKHRNRQVIQGNLVRALTMSAIAPEKTEENCVPHDTSWYSSWRSSSPYLQWIQLKSQEEDEVTWALHHMIHRGTLGKMLESQHWERSNEIWSSRRGIGHYQKIKEEGSVNISTHESLWYPKEPRGRNLGRYSCNLLN